MYESKYRLCCLVINILHSSDVAFLCKRLNDKSYKSPNDVHVVSLSLLLSNDDEEDDAFSLVTAAKDENGKETKTKTMNVSMNLMVKVNGNGNIMESISPPVQSPECRGTLIS